MVFQQTAKSFAALHLPCPVRMLKLWFDDFVTQSLVRTFSV
jgi:hypothetical protein